MNLIWLKTCIASDIVNWSNLMKGNLRKCLKNSKNVHIL